MEGDAELLGRLPRLDQQARGLGAGDAELALQRDLAVLGACTATRTHSVRSRQPPVSSAIFFSSSSLSRAKLRTPNSANARRMAVRDLTGCMKCSCAPGIVAASSISGIEATSKWRMPAPYSAPSRNTELFAL